MFAFLFANPASTPELSLTIEADARNLNLWSWIGGEMGGAETNYSTFNITIDTGVVIGSTSTGSFAFQTGNFPSGSTLNIINNGTIVGCGGAGGGIDEDGGDGGNAMYFSLDATVTNNGTIGGGGGGGGGSETIYGGSGGAGDLPGSAGSGPEPGDPGSLLTGGSAVGLGGAGGNLGADGDDGASGLPGGTAGDAVHKNGNTVTITNNGTISGSVVA